MPVPPGPPYDALVRICCRTAPARTGYDPAGSALRLPDPEEALRPLHAGDGLAGHRLPAGEGRRGGGDAAEQLRSGQDLRHLLRRRLDPAHLRRADDRHRGHAATAPGQHRPPGRRHRGPARARHHPGQHRRPDPLPLHPRLHAGADRAQVAQHRRGVPEDRDAADRLLGQHAQVLRHLSEVDVRRRGHQGERLRLRLASRASPATTRTCR